MRATGTSSSIPNAGGVFVFRFALRWPCNSQASVWALHILWGVAEVSRTKASSGVHFERGLATGQAWMGSRNGIEAGPNELGLGLWAARGRGRSETGPDEGPGRDGGRLAR